MDSLGVSWRAAGLIVIMLHLFPTSSRHWDKTCVSYFTEKLNETVPGTGKILTQQKLCPHLPSLLLPVPFRHQRLLRVCGGGHGNDTVVGHVSFSFRQQRKDILFHQLSRFLLTPMMRPSIDQVPKVTFRNDSKRGGAGCQQVGAVSLAYPRPLPTSK